MGVDGGDFRQVGVLRVGHGDRLSARRLCSHTPVLSMAAKSRPFVEKMGISGRTSRIVALIIGGEVLYALKGRRTVARNRDSARKSAKNYPVLREYRVKGW